MFFWIIYSEGVRWVMVIFRWWLFCGAYFCWRATFFIHTSVYSKAYNIIDNFYHHPSGSCLFSKERRIENNGLIIIIEIWRITIGTILELSFLFGVHSAHLGYSKTTLGKLEDFFYLVSLLQIFECDLITELVEIGEWHQNLCCCSFLRLVSKYTSQNLQ